MATVAAESVAPTWSATDLRCEYLIDPLGIDDLQPRLSWKLVQAPGERGKRQSAYRVLVASNQESLDADRGDLWDSGRVASDQSHLVAYAGLPLRSRLHCWWKVKVWDEQGQASDWSPIAQLVHGTACTW